VREFCASLNERDLTAIPRKSAPNSTARGTMATKITSTVHSDRPMSPAARSPKRKRPVRKVRSMLARFRAAAIVPTVATAMNLPATRFPAGTGTVRRASSVPRSFSPAARSMAG
jgi:hypothetical protein